MTVIAYNYGILAADKRIIGYGNIGVVVSTTKIHKIGEMLIGYAGDSLIHSEMVKWVENGFDPNTMPRQKIGCGQLLVIDKNGYRIYENFEKSLSSPVLTQTTYMQKFIAIGSGSAEATTAMTLGKTSVDAVKIAIDLRTDCGNGVDTLTL